MDLYYIQFTTNVYVNSKKQKFIATRSSSDERHVNINKTFFAVESYGVFLQLRHTQFKMFWDEQMLFLNFPC